MNVSKICLLIFFQLVCNKVFSSSGDSILFINGVLKYACAEIDYSTERKLFSLQATEEKPFIYVYVSHADGIRKPEEMNAPFVFCGTDESKGEEEIAKMRGMGYHTFCYKTYANSAARLNARLLSYENDAISFIVFHEIIHNFLNEQKIRIPYVFEEALCDVVGNYGTLRYAGSSANLNKQEVKHQIRSNEKIYKSLNATVIRIKLSPGKVDYLNSQCEASIKTKLRNSNSFQQDRFNYIVNNAYLLKNQYYAKHYFLLKRVYLKLKSLKALVAIMKYMPDSEGECVLYLNQYL